jgi:hypothetical protein
MTDTRWTLVPPTSTAEWLRFVGEDTHSGDPITVERQEQPPRRKRVKGFAHD